MLLLNTARFVVLCSFLSFTCANLASEYDHSAFLDPDETFRLFWSVKDGEKSISLAVEVKTTGWVGFGISQGLSGSMKGADIVIGWVDSTGKGHISDRYATSNSMPLVDGKQDYELIAASQDKGITVMKFKRKLKTCDKNDNDIPLGTAKVIYAYGKTDDVKYHGSKMRGARSVNLMNYVKNVPPPSNAKYFDVKINNVSVPKVKTTYWCEAFKLSQLVKLSGARHVIEIAPLVEKKDLGVVHHMVLYACKENFDESHLNASGACRHPNMPDSVRECVGRASVYAWAVGGVNFKFPGHVGWPIGTSYSMKYVVLETHFDNPSEKSDFVVSTGLRLYYDMPRKYEAATLMTGSTADASLIVPPRQENWVVAGYCPKECSRMLAAPGALKQDEVKMFASFPHAHTLATGIWTKHVRDGVEQEEVIRDASYDFDYQQTYVLKKELAFKAGDELITYCRYNSMKRKDAALGGESTTEEMCLNFIMYYPRANFTGCYSQELQAIYSFAKHYAKPVYEGPGFKFNRSAKPQPFQYQNWTDVKWNKTMVEGLQNVYKYTGPYALYPSCSGTFGVFHEMKPTKKVVIKQSRPPLPDVCAQTYGSSDAVSGSLLHAVLAIAFGLLLCI